MKYHKSFTRSFSAVSVFIGAIFLLLVVTLGYRGCTFYGGGTRIERITVESKESINRGRDTPSSFLVFTKDAEYECTDVIFYGNWDSTSDYNRLKVGSTYDVRVIGKRNPYLSMYPVILDVVTEIK